MVKQDWEEELAGRKHRRYTFGQLCKTPGAAKRKLGLARSLGWDELQIEEVRLVRRMYYKVTGVRSYRIVQELSGTVEGISAPMKIDNRRRHAGASRHRGSRS